jgi:two-component system, OmpR family, KDP operon response regulator KdpE
MTRILVVDDEPQLLRALRINLKARHYDVDTAITGVDALREAGQRMPDAVLLDLGLPDMDGRDVILGLRGWTAVPNFCGSRPRVPVRRCWIDLASHTVIRHEDLDANGPSGEAVETVRLTRTEWRLLEILLRHSGQLVSSRQLLSEVWGASFDTESGYLRFHIAKLRRKLEPDPLTPRHLLTEYGVGYRFVPTRGVEPRPSSLGR